MEEGMGKLEAGESKEIDSFYEASEGNTALRDLPGGPVIKNPPSDAVDSGSPLGGGSKIPHAAQQQSRRITTRESVCWDC